MGSNYIFLESNKEQIKTFFKLANSSLKICFVANNNTDTELEPKIPKHYYSIKL